MYAGNRSIALAGMPTYGMLSDEERDLACARAVAWQFWTTIRSALKALQARPCGETGGRSRKTAEVDHRIPAVSGVARISRRALAGVT